METPSDTSVKSGTPATSRLVPIAPASEIPAAPADSKNDAPLMPYTCVTCSRRKVKCDKTQPCTACRKGHLECVYQAPAPRKRKRRTEDVYERLEKYSRILQDNGLLPNDSEGSPEEPSPGSHLELPVNRTALLEKRSPPNAGTLIKGPGKTRYVASNVWKTLGDDLHPSSDEEEDEYGHLAATATASEPLDPASNAFLGASHVTVDLLPLHPTYDNALKLWRLYVQNVDPIIKFVHVPTGVTMVQRSAAQPSSMSKVTECLLFAIYHFAIKSISEQECQDLFGQPWAVLQKRYHDATKQALVGCQFLRTTEMAVLQAYFLYLLAIRNSHDPHIFWILTGIAVRIAQRMGLHRDGEELGLSPFDVQMRRRLFWQLLPLDGLAAQLCGTGIAISADSWDTKQPLNLNDEDIWPGMETTPAERKGATDMMFCLARTEIGRFHQKVKPALGRFGAVWDEKAIPVLEEALREMENNMEEKYIRYCDISNPIHCLTIAMARASLASARMRIRLPRARMHGASPEERQELCALSVKVLDHDIAINNNKSMSGFHWHLHSFFRWEPLIWILNECRHDAPVIDVEAAWCKIEDIFNKHPEMILQKRSVDVAVARLAIKSWDATQKRRQIAIPDPSFITSLRQSLKRKETSRHPTGMNDVPPTTMNHHPSSGSPTDVANDYPVLNYLNAHAGAGFVNFDVETSNEWNADLDWMLWDNVFQNTTPQPSFT